MNPQLQYIWTGIADIDCHHKTSEKKLCNILLDKLDDPFNIPIYKITAHSFSRKIFFFVLDIYSNDIPIFNFLFQIRIYFFDIVVAGYINTKYWTNIVYRFQV